MPLSFQPRIPPHRRKRRAVLTSPAAANVVSVTGTYSDPITVWTFDREVVIESGATFEMFNLHLADGTETRIGIAGNQTSATTIEIEMLFPPEDYGQPWMWQVTFFPPKIKTVDGAGVDGGEGVASIA